MTEAIPMPDPLSGPVRAWLDDWRADPAAFARTVCARPSPVTCTGSDWLAQVVGLALLRCQGRVAVAESCTGGALGQALTAIAGSSAWVEGGFITYSNAAKSRLLGVPADLIAAHGAVSRQVVEAMASGAQQGLAAEWAVAVSGVAGPGGGSAHKPVGTVWLAWAGPGGGLRSQGLWFPGDRAAVRQGAVLVGLTGLLALLAECCFSGDGGEAGMA